MSTSTAIRTTGSHVHAERIVSGGSDGVVRVWHSGTGVVLCVFDGYSEEAYAQLSSFVDRINKLFE